jgi:hypothetical protein
MIKCISCNENWNEGATRDYRMDQACRHCLNTAIDKSGGRVLNIRAHIEQLEAEKRGVVEDRDQVETMLYDTCQERDALRARVAELEAALSLDQVLPWAQELERVTLADFNGGDE